jgi:hypothetical protein
MDEMEERDTRVNLSLDASKVQSENVSVGEGKIHNKSGDIKIKR